MQKLGCSWVEGQLRASGKDAMERNLLEAKERWTRAARDEHEEVFPLPNRTSANKGLLLIPQTCFESKVLKTSQNICCKAQRKETKEVIQGSAGFISADATHYSTPAHLYRFTLCIVPSSVHTVCTKVLTRKFKLRQASRRLRYL